MNWQDIYPRLDPKEPLSPGGDRLAPELYINDFFNEVKDKLQLEGDRNYKLLLSGHTGCVKSTFLKLLAADPEIQSHFHLDFCGNKTASDTLHLYCVGNALRID